MLDEIDHSIIGLNLGGLVVRMKTIIPFMDHLKEQSSCHLRILNLGGTDVPPSNVLQAFTINK